MIEIEFWRLVSAYIFVVIVLLIFQWRGISRKLKLTIATLRMTFQLVIAGYILSYLFDNPNPFLVVLVVLFMELFAIYTIFKSFDISMGKRLKVVIATSMFVGIFISVISTLIVDLPLILLFYFHYVVLNVSTWFDHRYTIPIAGMMIGNAMTGVTLGVQSLLDNMIDNREKIEGSLMLGATPNKAVKPYVDRAFDSAVLPTINNMIGMGIVFLPGMMTGQILAGLSPTMAIKYQLAIMLGILGGVAMSVILFTQFAYRTFFTKDMQLIHQTEKKN